MATAGPSACWRARLNRLGVKSTDLIIATKVGHFPGTAEHAYEPAHIRHQCEQSLINLQRDYIDLYYFHHGDFGENDRYLAGAVDMMNRLVAEGKVRYVGLSAYSLADFVRLVPTVKPHVLQSWANAFSDVMIREGSPVQDLMAKYDLAYVAFSPLAQGRLPQQVRSQAPAGIRPRRQPPRQGRLLGAGPRRTETQAGQDRGALRRQHGASSPPSPSNTSWRTRASPASSPASATPSKPRSTWRRRSCN